MKDLSMKLYEWTSDRWIITLSKSKGEISIKDRQRNLKNELLKTAKESEIYKDVLEKFHDAKLIVDIYRNYSFILSLFLI